MTNKFYEPGMQRAARVKELFTTIAPRYNLINDLQSGGLHRWWKKRLIQRANPQPAERALDLCCGTGDVALALARRGAAVVGLDFSAAMLEVAVKLGRELALGPAVNQTNGLEPLRFIQADAEHIPFPDASFDIVTIGYGLRNLASWETGLREMCRVAKPGGRVLVLDFGKPDNACWRGLYFAYLKMFVPLFGRVFFGDAQTYAYILESLKRFPAQQGVAARMRRMPFKEVRIINLLGGIMSINYAVKTG
ncbi:MAG: ubiquinone/menaquinone biosynthesis methyltransferase [Verrucomicrobia bacterium]|nr:ubiquinone/menaquinone biosynthesis methyltransferase [Verrucomicrobiota bacterium]